MAVIETDHYFFREIEDDDCDAIFMIYSEKEVCRYFGINPLKEMSEARGIITYFKKSDEDHTSFSLAIVSKKSDDLIGLCHFQEINLAYRKAELSFELNKTSWCKGVMTEVLKSFISYGFEQLNFNRIQANVCADNKGSVKLLEKNGFEKEGVLRENIFNFVDNCFEDTVVYGKLKKK